MDVAYIIELFPVFLQKLPFTLEIIAAGFVFGFVLAFFITLGRINKVPVIAQILDLYVSFIRCIPSILLLFLVYYGLPVFLKNIFSIDLYQVDRFYFGILSLILFNGGQMSEILRAAFLAVDEEQTHLADSLGYTYLQKLHRVIIPQGIRVALPDLKNALINVMKDSALLFTIGIIDMMGLADIYIGNNYGIRQAEIYIAVASVYWICSLLLEGIAKLVEIGLSKEGLDD